MFQPDEMMKERGVVGGPGGSRERVLRRHVVGDHERPAWQQAIGNGFVKVPLLRVVQPRQAERGDDEIGPEQPVPSVQRGDIDGDDPHAVTESGQMR